MDTGPLHRTKLLTWIFSTAVLLLSASVAHAGTYDAYEDFGSTQGANGVWHYLQYDGSSYLNLTYQTSITCFMKTLSRGTGWKQLLKLLACPMIRNTVVVTAQILPPLAKKPAK